MPEGIVLACLEQTNGVLHKAALVVINAALQAKSVHGYSKTVGLFMSGESAAKAAAEAAKYGLDEVLFVKSDTLQPYMALNHAAAFNEVLKNVQAGLVLFASTSQGKDLAPRIAFALDAGQASDVLEFLSGGTFRRLMYAGNIVADVELTSAAKVATIRTTAFEPATPGGAAAPVREIPCSLTSDARQKFVSFDTVKSERPELTEAEIVVSGGRAMKSAENFEKYLAPLADVLGAALGASRAAVDSGYAPNDWQVGQTGKVVAPALYIAIGISGAIQHLAGMKDSKVIVAINKDSEAPIFEVADYGLVADLYESVPQFIDEIKKIKGS